MKAGLGRKQDVMSKPLIQGNRSPQKISRARELRQQQTVSEQYLWQNLRNNRLDGFHFRRQHVIDGFIVDFYCHQLRLVVEVDGPVHQYQQDYDKERAHILHQHELHLIRFTDAEVMEEMETVLRKLRITCQKLSEQKEISPLESNAKDSFDSIPRTVSGGMNSRCATQCVATNSFVKIYIEIRSINL